MLDERLPVVLGITGASGAVYAQRLLDVLVGLERRVQLTISRSGQTLLRQELGLHVDLDDFSVSALGLKEQEKAEQYIDYYHYADYFSPPASGSARSAGMVVCPCSGGTLSAVAHGASTNLVQRAAEVHLKEKRKLILVPRETPLSLVTIDNMRRVCEAGAVMLPASPGWYHEVNGLQDLVDFVVARILDQLDVQHNLMRRWGDEA